MITEDALRAAASTIDTTSPAELHRRFSALERARRSRTQVDALRQQAELDSLELDRPAYDAASQAAAEGDLPKAVRWYRVAAVNDFADAPLRLAMVLDSLAERYLSQPGGRTATREEMDIVAEAICWYATAYAAGDIEAGDRIEDLVARHDFTEARTAPVLAAVSSETERSPQLCTMGGLIKVTGLQLTEASSHVGTCRPCIDELIRLGGLLPLISRQATEKNTRARPRRRPESRETGVQASPGCLETAESAAGFSQ